MGTHIVMKIVANDRSVGLVFGHASAERGREALERAKRAWPE